MDENQPASGRRNSDMPAATGGLCAFDGERTDETGTTVVGYDHEADPPGIAVPTLVAQCAGVDPLSLPSMHDAIDAEALEKLFDGRDSAAADIGVTFRYAGYTVTVGNQLLSVRPVE
ncbi:HalOD1 output domain-containing protein [Haloarcula rara]|uniref:HalOD1 output domain-containing protein n=1 Tax=Haloarcula rara TaxID=3033387 RepID=UPI0023E88A51|nr:HalOD1 output domain-containing protein [Halomicroarcula sp. SHR3]